MRNYIKRSLKKLAGWIVARYYSRCEMEDLFFRRCLTSPLTYAQDGLYTIHNCDFVNDLHFAESYRLGKATGSWGSEDIHWRAYIACVLAEKAARLEGDFVECGVNRGGLSRAIIHYTNFPLLNKTLHLFDTFQGLEDRCISAQERGAGIRAGGYGECYSAVLETFREFPVNIVRGPVPDTLATANIRKVAYLSLDMNCVLPEVAAAEFFWDKLSIGAVVLLDDYGWCRHIEQKKGLDRFAESRNTRIIQLPTGQGVIVKEQ